MANHKETEKIVLKNWTKEEKFQLLEALKEIGSEDVEQISFNFVPTKNIDEINLALKFYKDLSLARSAPVTKKRRRNYTQPVIPLASWSKFISDCLNFEELQTETATALRLIAELEDRPPSVCTENIDFKKIYSTVADALDGKAMPDNKYIKSVLDKCIVETALTSKAFMRNTTYKNILSSVNMSDKDMNFVPKVTNNKELANLRHLAVQKNYNPLNISEVYLKSSL